LIFEADTAKADSVHYISPDGRQVNDGRRIVAWSDDAQHSANGQQSGTTGDKRCGIVASIKQQSASTSLENTFYKGQRL